MIWNAGHRPGSNEHSFKLAEAVPGAPFQQRISHPDKLKLELQRVQFVTFIRLGFRNCPS